VHDLVIDWAAAPSVASTICRPAPRASTRRRSVCTVCGSTGCARWTSADSCATAGGPDRCCATSRG